ISYAWEEKPVIRGLTTTIIRGDRIGIIGPNGCGKTTLLNLLLGKLVPNSGKVNLGTKVEVAYFDQLRAALDEEKSVGDNVADGSDNVEVGGSTKHVISYLQDFLFTPDRVRQPVKALSGGERNRLLLAKLFTKPANVLVMDEPTNDLDMETLELLEELLLDYQGTLLLVSHDRAFLNNVVTSSLVFEGQGRVNEYVGGYDDWLRQRQPANAQKPLAASQAKSKTEKPKSKPKSKKLSYKDQRELEALPKRIEELERVLDELQNQMADPAFYQQGGDAIAEAKAKVESAETELSGAFERWESLEAMLEE
ncbi:MAG: ATP-binding cassette domain-containing protein, partial [Candidatus Sedimenticola sp. 6PFRAG7]